MRHLEKKKKDGGKKKKTKLPSFLSSHGSSGSSHDHTLQHPVNSSGKQQLAILALSLSLSMPLAYSLPAHLLQPPPPPGLLLLCQTDRAHTHTHTNRDQLQGLQVGSTPKLLFAPCSVSGGAAADGVVNK